MLMRSRLSWALGGFTNQCGRKSQLEFQFTPPSKLSNLSPESLASVSDDEIESVLVGYVLDHSVQGTDEPEAIAGLPAPLQAWYVAFVVDAEVLNGGFNQFFFNSSGALAHLAPSAFAQIGIPEAGDLVTQAVELLEAHGPALEAADEAGTIEAFMETYIDQPFGELDERYGVREEQWRLARIRFLRQVAPTLKHP